MWSKSVKALSTFFELSIGTSTKASKFKELARRAESARQSVLFGLKKELRTCLPYKKKKKNKKVVGENAEQESEEAEDPHCYMITYPQYKNKNG